jgi:AraC-like DNA-binding protein
MRFQLFAPCDRLKPFVRHFVISEAEEAQCYPVLPDTALVMGFQYRGGLTHIRDDIAQPLAKAGITGLLDGYRLFRNQMGTGTVLVVFRETGLAAFVRQPVHELFDQSLALDQLFPRQAIADTEERLAAANDDTGRIRVVEGFLLPHLSPPKTDPLVEAALDHIHRLSGDIRIGELARALHSSQSPLEKRFRRSVGATPKKFAGIVRIKTMITALQQRRDRHYLDAYYDQAHFIKDFKRFTSMTPEEWLRVK